MGFLGKAVVSAVFVLALVGCTGDGTGNETGNGAANGAGVRAFAPFAGLLRGKAPRSTHLANRQVTVEGPHGYCIDKGSKQTNASGGFVVLGACPSLSGNDRAPNPQIRAVLSVSVLKIQSGQVIGPQALHRYFQEDAGQAALAQSGNGTDVNLVAANVEGDALVLQASDRSPSRSARLSDTYWRGMFAVNGHLVSLTVSPLDAQPVSQSEGQTLMRNFVKAMQNANPAQ